MNVEYFTLGLLAVLLIASNVFWARMLLALSNRLMSRNYFEFVQTEKFKASKPPKVESDSDEMVPDPDGERQADELNSIMAFV